MEWKGHFAPVRVQGLTFRSLAASICLVQTLLIGFALEADKDKTAGKKGV